MAGASRLLALHMDFRPAAVSREKGIVRQVQTSLGGSEAEPTVFSFSAAHSRDRVSSFSRFLLVAAHYKLSDAGHTTA